MLIVRCTAKLLTRLKLRPEAASASSTTLFGDWYATILPVRPSHLVLLVNEGTRLAALLPAREIPTLRRRIPEAILETLRRVGPPAERLESERRAMAEIRFDRTARSVLGTMNDFVFLMESGPTRESWSDLRQLGTFLNRTPISPLRYERPEDAARRLLCVARGPKQAARMVEQPRA